MWCSQYVASFPATCCNGFASSFLAVSLIPGGTDLKDESLQTFLMHVGKKPNKFSHKNRHDFYAKM